MDFDSNLDVSNDRKVEIVVKLLESSRTQIMSWHNQAYVAASASLGLMLVVINVCLTARSKTLVGLLAYEVGIVALATFGQLYLRATHENYANNEKHKLKCEYALRLKDENAYFNGARFYWAERGEMERGMPARDIRVLRWSHAIASFLLVTICAMAFLEVKA
jgi:hypothetical protein